MLYAEWSGCAVTIYEAVTRQLIRRIKASHNVVGVQISGDSHTDAMVAIAMDNGRTEVYKSSGQFLHR